MQRNKNSENLRKKLAISKPQHPLIVNPVI